MWSVCTALGVSRECTSDSKTRTLSLTELLSHGLVFYGHIRTGFLSCQHCLVFLCHWLENQSCLYLLCICLYQVPNIFSPSSDSQLLSFGYSGGKSSLVLVSRFQYCLSTPLLQPSGLLSATSNISSLRVILGQQDFGGAEYFPGIPSSLPASFLPRLTCEFTLHSFSEVEVFHSWKFYCTMTKIWKLTAIASREIFIVSCCFTFKSQITKVASYTKYVC